MLLVARNFIPHHELDQVADYYLGEIPCSNLGDIRDDMLAKIPSFANLVELRVFVKLIIPDVMSSNVSCPFSECRIIY